jgi:hypothetical protein
MEEKICEECGNPYIPTKSNQKTCSDECRKIRKEREGKIYCDKNKKRKSDNAKIYYQNNKEEIKSKVSEYYKNNTEEILQYAKEYRENNPDKISKYKEENKDSIKEYKKIHDKQYREENLEECRQRSRDGYAKNREERIKKGVEYGRTPKGKEVRRKAVKKYKSTEKGRDNSRKHSMWRRAVIAGATIGEIEFDIIWERDGGKCHLCKKNIDLRYKKPHPLSLEYEHLIPLKSEHPEHSTRNLFLSHRQCNARKGNNIKEGIQPLLLS